MSKIIFSSDFILTKSEIESTTFQHFIHIFLSIEHSKNHRNLLNEKNKYVLFPIQILIPTGYLRKFST